MENIINQVDMKTLENVITNLVFKSMTVEYGFKNFQYITDIEQLHTPNNSYSPQDIYTHAPEQAIISIDVPAQSTGYPLPVNGHLFSFTGNIPAGTKTIATPIVSFWMPLTGSTDLYVSTYNGNGSQHIWRKISINYEDKVEIKNTNEDVTCTYRLIQGRFLEFSIDTTHVKYPTQTAVFTLPYQPLEGRALYFPMIQWINNGVPTGMNGARILADGSVQLICVDNYVHTHGIFAIK